MNTNLPSELEQLITTLWAESKCFCHIINPHKTRILMWKQVQAGQTTYCLKIGIQKFFSQVQTDRNGETYWRFWSSYETKPEEKEASNPEAPTLQLDPITKFNQRQEKAQEYGKSIN